MSLSSRICRCVEGDGDSHHYSLILRESFDKLCLVGNVIRLEGSGAEKIPRFTSLPYRRDFLFVSLNILLRYAALMTLNVLSICKELLHIVFQSKEEKAEDHGIIV